jgi:hypothetical protein
MNPDHILILMLIKAHRRTKASSAVELRALTAIADGVFSLGITKEAP